jgi:2-polyprenyl-6-methoxyphenol hydroxylase-like FAD-dependent oxidoreductase
MDLALRGIAVTVAETRAAREVPTVRCNHVAARSMEIFRRLGLAHKLRQAGLPADYPHDASFRTTVIGTEMSRIPIPCRRLAHPGTPPPHQPALFRTHSLRPCSRH